MKRVGGIRNLPNAASKQSTAGAFCSRRPPAAAGCGVENAGDGLHHFGYFPPLNRKDKAEHEEKQYQHHSSFTQPHVIEAMLRPFLS
ncbi:hypothetical protein KFK09_027494 [Dendrobium nobile]|uniref:Uncharacterized protein n=1 Tax=Dendrobium nobile TaxID=94219 RepID=A0A8T3AAP8_DENNO|nr:hypothetical protein KFK09_027494 [Dendrobium nobile]